MNAFSECRSVEQRSLEILRPYIQQRSFNGQYVITNKGPLARDLQKTVGDALFNSDSDTVWSIEIKAEEQDKYGNLFLETWSNRKQYTPGWMITLNADLLLYHFISDQKLVRLPLQNLKAWAFQDGKIYEYPEKEQNKYTQLNDTWGRTVPIVDLKNLKGFEILDLSHLEN